MINITAEQQQEAYDFLRDKLAEYSKLNDETWSELVKITDLLRVKKNEHLLNMGEVPRSFYFVVKGIFRAYSVTGADKDKEINKNFFEEGRFPGSISALLKKSESTFAIQALENSIVIRINHAKYRDLLKKYPDLLWNHVIYVERHWVLEKEPQEISMLGEEAKQRYLNFVKEHPTLMNRISLYHVASRLGITSTQLSRIRKEIK